jgi:hypothetical protein
VPHGGTGGPRAPLVLSLSMWLTEKKVGACFRNKIVHAVGKIARVGGGIVGRFGDPDGPTVPRGTGGPRAPLVLSLSMWLTEKKIGACFRNKIVCVVGKIASVGGGGLEQPMAEGQHFLRFRCLRNCRPLVRCCFAFGRILHSLCARKPFSAC